MSHEYVLDTLIAKNGRYAFDFQCRLRRIVLISEGKTSTTEQDDSMF